MNSSRNSAQDKKIVIAIDGFSSGGKSTFARMLAARLGYIFIDTGGHVPCRDALRHRTRSDTERCSDRERLVGMLGEIAISFRFNPRRQASDIYVNGECVEEKIRGIEVSAAVSSVSSIPEVRRKLVALQQRMGKDKGVVMDGRDIGTVVFPDAELKLFMTADPKVRAVRRYEELRARGDDVSLEEIERNIRARDRADQEREVSPLRMAPDAVVLNNSDMTLAQQMEWIEPILEEKIRGI